MKNLNKEKQSSDKKDLKNTAKKAIDDLFKKKSIAKQEETKNKSNDT